ncbi:MAG: peptidylprolyl isomerase [Opitutus sp.]
MHRLRVLRAALKVAALWAVLTGGSISATEPLADGIYAEFTTSRGTILAELYFTQAACTVSNFVGLAEGTLGPSPRKPFYDGLTFHRVVPGFVVQGGDPLGTGAGGPGYQFPDEFVPGLRHDRVGVLSMANSGADTNGSQFFFTLAPVNRLNYLHSVFGRVVRGFDVLPQIQAGDKMTVTIRRIGSAAKAFRADLEAFNARIAQTPRAEPAHFEDPDSLLPTTPPRAKFFDLKLANFQRATSVKVYARVYERFTPDTAGQQPADLVQSLARAMELPSDAALAVYFHDRKVWTMWVGQQLLPRFVAPSGSSDSSLLERAEQRLFTLAQQEAEKAIADAMKAAPPDKPVTDAQRVKLRTDAVLDALLVQLEPTRP